MNVEELQKLYTTDSVARAFYDHMASRRYNQSETKLKRILQLLNSDGYEVKRSEIIGVFRRLEELGLGQYVEGRHGWPSRFVWSVDCVSACRAAAGETTQVGTLAQSDDEASTDREMLAHSYNLRADLQIVFSLPVDLSASEAERIATFVKTLPFEEYE